MGYASKIESVPTHKIPKTEIIVILVGLVGLVTVVDGYIPAAAPELQGLSNIFLIDECVLLLRPRRVSAIIRGV